MAYTPPTFKTKAQTAPTGATPSVIASNFGNLQTDAQRSPMTGVLGNYSQSQDAAASPVVSPVTVTTTQTLKVPQGAAICNIISTTNAVQVTEDSSFTATFSVPAGQIYAYNCANQQFVYLKVGSSTVVNFQFVMV